MSEIHAQTVRFVRETMLPPAVPPRSEAGAVRWLRENLLSGPVNIALTILGLALLYGVLQAVVPWLMHSVWNAKSLGECREIVAQTWGPDASGACWAMIRERWPQYLFGFYPQELYWRPTLAFLLMFVALAPVLFSGLPRGLLWFSAVYPMLAFWLLWGGAVWWWVVVALGFVLAYAAFRLAVQRSSTIIAGAAALAVLVGWNLFAIDPLAALIQRVLPASIAPVSSDRFGGFLLSITIGITAIAGSLPLGILLALGRRSDMPLVKMLSVAFIEFIRGVPLITVLFVASLLLQYFLPPRTQFDIILRVIIMATIFAAAYIAEVIRGGLAALPRGQYEAADSLGMDYWQAQRLIIMPQALKISIPGIVSSFIGLFKDTTLVAFVGLNDPLKGITQVVRADINWKGIYWEPYVFVGAIFFLICFGMSRYSMYLERRLKRDNR